MEKNRRILNITLSRDTQKDWRIEHAIKSGQVKEEEISSIPDEKDLRENWWKIGDQGNTGSCVGWATADSVLRWYFVKARRLAKDSKLSVRFIWMASKEMDDDEYYPSTMLEADGTSLKAALDIARNYGCVEESVLPFTLLEGGMVYEQLYTGEPETFLGLASRCMIRNYFNLSTPETKLDDWRKWIATKGPVLARLDVDDEWFSLDQTENPGKFNLDVYQKPPEPAGHAVALVGYTRDRFIVRNSWGEGWGDKGYGYASIEYAQAAFNEAYGITLFP